jgi:hypothetical protein
MLPTPMGCSLKRGRRWGTRQGFPVFQVSKGGDQRMIGVGLLTNETDLYYQNVGYF